MASVSVTNLSKKATEDDLRNFFSFTGEVSAISIKEGDDCNSAEVTFVDDKSLETALLLTGAVFHDREVAITASGETPAVSAKAPTKSAQDMVTTMLAKGYTLTADALTKAKAYDEKHKITATALEKAKELDEKYGVSDKAKAAAKAAEEKFREVDEQYKVKERANSALAEGSKHLNAAAGKAMENPTVAQGVNFLKSGMASLTTKATEIKDETLAKASK